MSGAKKKTGPARLVVTLSDGTRVVLRRCNKLDMWEAHGAFPLTEGEDDSPDRKWKIGVFLLSRAAVTPKIETRGFPPESPPPGMLHVLDIADEDLDVLLRAVNDFALGGARSEAFRADSEGEARDPALSCEDVREAPARDSEPTTERV